ncbi:MAG: hypothetical protein JSR77_14070 [Planctomycetes bacterium]|nr:hypothetical protein [Planctomycetota bacterium]
MRSLGEFFGHIWKGVSTDPSPTKRIEVARKVQEAVRETPDGPVKLRRTTVDEVEVPNPGAVNKPLRG